MKTTLSPDTTPWPVRTLSWQGDADANVSELLDSEWLTTNGIGGYASGTVAGVATRKYHGLLVAAIPVHGRTVMLNHLEEVLRTPKGQRIRIGGIERHDSLEVCVAHLEDFSLEMGLPVWRYRIAEHVVEKRVFMIHGQNSTQICYRLIEGSSPVRVQLRPALAFRRHEEPVREILAPGYVLTTSGNNRYEISAPDYPSLRLSLTGAAARFVIDWHDHERLHHRLEAARGYDAVQSLLRPGQLRLTLHRNAPDAYLVISTEPWETLAAQSPALAFDAECKRRRHLLSRASIAAEDALTAELVLAADAFIVTPGWRVHDVARGHAAGVHFRSIIAGYHWFTDWGRDTMIALEGLTLLTGRHQAARDILRTFAEHVRDGLIPNLFPEGCEDGLYHTADATLWFFHALDRYLEWTGDVSLRHELMPRLMEIAKAHLDGTRFGIGVDPDDGLLRQGAAGYQLTWMDAKVGDWVVTPRRGKAVEINALWYNALRLLAGWLRDEGDAKAAESMHAHADRACGAFNRRFWYADGGHLYDVIDGENGDDPAFRPNQIFAISLRHPVLSPERWPDVLSKVRRQLLTPLGLRSLAPGHPDYKSRYFGDLRSRDAAYHQGTVWAWLIGPYIDAWLKLHPDDVTGARTALQGLLDHLGEAGIGSVSEVFDAEPPFTPRACIAQAWSVAELLRSRIRTFDPEQATGTGSRTLSAIAH